MQRKNRTFRCGFVNGANGDRTHDLSRVRRTLIPAELWLLTEEEYSMFFRKMQEENKGFRPLTENADFSGAGVIMGIRLPGMHLPVPDIHR